MTQIVASKRTGLGNAGKDRSQLLTRFLGVAAGVAILLSILSLKTHAAEVHLVWNPNQESDLAGYKLYYGPGSRSYEHIIDVGNQTDFTVSALPGGNYFFAVTAYNLLGYESGFSNEVSTNIESRTWILPSSARAPGAYGAFYTTDLTVANTGSVDAVISYKFLGHAIDGRGGREFMTLLPRGGQITYQDVLNRLFDLVTDFGAIQITSPEPHLAILGETSTPNGEGGSYGQSVPAISASRRITYAHPQVILGIRDDMRFRTNLALANSTESELRVEAVAYDESGMLLGGSQYKLPPLGMTQPPFLSELGLKGRFPGGYLLVSILKPGGSLAAYATVIDNVTNDPRTLLPMAVDPGGGEGFWLLPSSARSGGLNGAFFTTDLTIVNPTAETATYTLKFLGNNTDGRSGPERSFMLGSGRSVTYPDVLGAVFALHSSQDFGAIMISSNLAGLCVGSQTSTPLSSGGTFGQSVPAFGMADFIRPGISQSIPAIREDAAFRTNLVMANATPTPLDVDAALLDETGTLIALRRFTLPPLGMTQARILMEFGLSRTLVNGRLQLSTATLNGAFAAYAATIDNSTNDPKTLLPQ